VITNDVVNQRRRTIVVIPISSGPKPAPPLAIPVSCAGRAGVAVVDQIRAAAKERFGNRVGSLTDDEMKAIEEGLKEVLGVS
jgi:mRNA interferase MazF